MPGPVQIRVNSTGVVAGPGMKLLNQRLNKEVVENPEWATVIAGLRGALTTVARFINPNATVNLQLKLLSDGSQVQVLIDLTATGI